MSTNRTHEAHRIVAGCSNDPHVHLHNVPNLKEIAYHEVARILHQLSANERKKLIFKVAESPLFHECSSESFNLLVNTCLPHFENQLALKEFVVMHSHHFEEYLYRLLIRDQEYEKFIGKIKFYCAYDASVIQVFKQQFLKEVLIPRHSSDIGLIFNFNKWNNFSKCIDETFENDRTSSLVVKKELISKVVSAYFTNFTNLKPRTHDQLVDYLKVLEMVFVDEVLKQDKPTFSSLCSVMIMKVNIRIMKYVNRKCAEWWSKDDIENYVRKSGLHWCKVLST